MEALETAISRLALLHSHDALRLLRNSISIPTPHFVLRTSDCYSHLALIRYDKVLREGLICILNVDLTNDQWTQTILPVKLEGLGFRSAVALTPSALMASAADTRTLQNTILPLAYRDQPDEAVDLSIKVWLCLSVAD